MIYLGIEVFHGMDSFVSEKSCKSFFLSNNRNTSKRYYVTTFNILQCLQYSRRFLISKASFD